MINITKQVIESLSKQHPLFDLFFQYHFEIIEIKSLIPKYGTDGSMSFPIKTIFKPKKLTEEESFKFFSDYFNLILKGERNEEKILPRI